jgi:HEPN domain-containing protein
MDNEQRTDYIDFINRSFRDIADGDYIAARILYRHGLGPQFLWSALQTIEKYLKAILLYNDKSTRHLGHDIYRAFQELNKIADIPFEFPQDVGEFIEHVNRQGNNRYFEKSAYTLGEELLVLDKAVWHVRRYCFYMKGVTTPGANGKGTQLFPTNITMIKAFRIKNANIYRIRGGFLEKILDRKESILRKHLVWKNFYYGTYKKGAIKHFTLHSWAANPAHFLHPEIYSILNKRVKFSKEIQDLFKEYEFER